MSCLLPITANEINLIRENGLTLREFSKIPTYPEYNTYDSCAFLMYKTKTKLNYFQSKFYRNHFTLYRSEDSLVIVLTETTLIHSSTDVELKFHVIKPITASRVVEEKWSISFDKIEYSKDRPRNFSCYKLHSVGEWWYFDHGIILNGLSSELNEAVESVLIYVELHPPDSFYIKMRNNNNHSKSFLNSINVQNIPKTTTEDDVITKNVDQNPSISKNINSTENKTTNSSHLFTVSTLPDIFASRVNKTLNLKQTNNTIPIKGKLQNIIPPLYWFETRAKELETSNIDYFRTHSNITLSLNSLPSKLDRSLFSL